MLIFLIVILFDLDLTVLADGSKWVNVYDARDLLEEDDVQALEKCLVCYTFATYNMLRFFVHDVLIISNIFRRIAYF